MVERRLARAAAQFWRDTDSQAMPAPPVDIERAVLSALHLDVRPVPGLTVRVAEREAARYTHGSPLSMDGPDRPLHGCLLARRGRGVIFVDANDPEPERRFTIAHEAAHFLLDYLDRRRVAEERLGASILPVLDGDRTPTTAERIDAALKGLVLGVHTHLMERGEDGNACANVDAAEWAADTLALELLAPTRSAGPLVQELGHAAATEILMARYGLPMGAAAQHADRLLRGRVPRRTFRDWLYGPSGPNPAGNAWYR